MAIGVGHWNKTVLRSYNNSVTIYLPSVFTKSWVVFYKLTKGLELK